MNRKISKEIENILKSNNITFEVACIKQLNEIYELYNNRTIWFKENNIKQWSKYIARHKKEFPIAIKNEKK